MAKSVVYDVYFAYGPCNGARRVYDSLGVAVAVAKRYVRKYSCSLCERDPYCEVYRLSFNPYRSLLVRSIDVYSLR